jgi:hypothetical protein
MQTIRLVDRADTDADIVTDFYTKWSCANFQKMKNGSTHKNTKTEPSSNSTMCTDFDI